jgi:parallel beta-helix repeat protein
MIKRILFSLFITGVALTVTGQDKPLTEGMQISKSIRIKKSNYRIDAPDASKPVVIIQGTDMVIDFNNAELRGSNQVNGPDEYAGTGILVQNSRNVIIRNLKARGYKIGLMARNVENLTLENCDLSYNYRQHLNSTQEKEDISDWMSYHHNEKDEWLRYGAGIYLWHCNKAVISNCRVTGGQNALMMTHCNNGRIFNNDFSFNSGIGIGMYRSSRNQVMYNRINFNVRGYSHGVYNRGQDSAGILVYEQSNENIFYKNSVTHGGDGFFLWAGQTTMDTGQGGCNENVLIGNDFSYAPTNGIEVTFSRNRISGNRIFECDHGIWGGYSYYSKIDGNKFGNNRIAIAIEHGQGNDIWYNEFSNDKEAIRLWSRAQQPSDWGYAKYRDTRSAYYVITGNKFSGHTTALNISRTDSVFVFGNTYSGVGQRFKFDSLVTHVDTMEMDLVDTTLVYPVVKNPINSFKGNEKLAGRKNILITEWGPYDFRSPVIWNTNPTDTGAIMKFDLIGPKGKWKIKSVKGLTGLSAMSGQLPSTLTASKIKTVITDIVIELEYTGEAITTVFGEKIPAGKPFIFSFRKFFQPIDWEVLFYSLDTAFYNPVREGNLFSPVERKAPFKTEKVNKLDYAWWGGIKGSDQQYKQFITVATASATFEKAKYELGVTWDDAVRVYVDEKLVINEWNPSLYTFDESPNRKIILELGGNHHIRVEHLELGGFATLSVKIKRLGKPQ